MLLAKLLSQLLGLSFVVEVFTVNLLITMENVIVKIFLFESFKEESVPYSEMFRGRKLLELVYVAFLEIDIEGVEIKISSSWIFSPLA